MRLLHRLLSWFLARLNKHVIGHICHGEPLLVRYDLFHSPWLRIYLHNHRRSDIDRDMHDHPWSFVSVLLTGSYIEHTPQGNTLLTAGTMIYRPSHWVHNLELNEPMWTLIFCGPKRREWGFHTPGGWVLWKQYDSIGKNCE